MISDPNSNIFTKSMSQLWHTASQLWHHVTIVTRLEILVLNIGTVSLTVFQAYNLRIFCASNLALFHFHTLQISCSSNININHMYIYIYPISYSCNLTPFQSHTLPIQSHITPISHTSNLIWESKFHKLFYFPSFEFHNKKFWFGKLEFLSNEGV